MLDPTPMAVSKPTPFDPGEGTLQVLHLHSGDPLAEREAHCLWRGDSCEDEWGRGVGGGGNGRRQET